MINLINSTELDLAYAAGIIDGEGCIGAYPHPSGRSFILKVSVSNTDMVLVNWFKEHFGGNVSSDSGLKQRGKRAICYQWRISSKSAGEFLKLVKPYLKIKTEQARVGIILQGLKGTYQSNNLGRTEDQVNLECRLANTLRSLKVVGKAG